MDNERIKQRTYSRLSAVLRGVKPTAYGKKWEYIDKKHNDPIALNKKNSISVECKMEDGEIKVFSDINSAAVFLNVDVKKAYHNIYRVIKGRGETAYGYKWRIANV